MSRARDCNERVCCWLEPRLDISYLYKKKSGDPQRNNYAVIEGKH